MTRLPQPEVQAPAYLALHRTGELRARAERAVSGLGACRYLNAERYPEAARTALKEMHRQVGDLVIDDDGLARRGLLVRHLVMPGAREDTRAIMRFLAEEISPDTYVNIMGQYRPAGRVLEEPEAYADLSRTPTGPEIREAYRMAREVGLQRFD